MQDIIFRQHDAARPMTGRAFVLGIAGILLKLAIAQIVCNLLITLTGVGLLNILFYVFAVCLLVLFMRDTVAGYVYTLMENRLVLERRLGDSTITMVEIPLESVVSMRQVRMAENLKTTYRQVTHIDPASRPVLRVRAAFLMSLVSSRLARMLAGRGAQDVIGHVLVYDEGGARRACTFCPNGEMQEKLAQALGERYGFDERMTHARVHTLYARALERAFPALYAYVDPLVKPEDVDWAREEVARQKAERQRKKNPQQADKPVGEAEEAGEAKEETAQEGAQDAPRRRRKQG